MTTRAGTSQGDENGDVRWGSLKHDLPTDEFPTWQDFEDFIERLLSAHRFCSDDVDHVVRVERWGRPGDKQDGIDFEGAWSDGRTAAWQCKRLRRLPPAAVTQAVEDCTFTAERYFLVFSRDASTDARKE